MKIIKARKNRISNPGIFIKDRDFTYKIDHAWAKWPSEIKGSDVLCPTCDIDDYLYCATSDPENPICVFDPGGNFVRSFGKDYFNRPHSISFTPKKTILVADSSPTLHVVKEITIDGKVVRTFGNIGQHSDTGINDKILNEKEKTYKDDDMFYWKLDNIKYAGKPFYSPCHMAVASTGEMFAADGYGNAAVHKFAADGTYLETWGNPGKKIGEFRLPHWINIDFYDRIWVCDRENSRAYAYSKNGEILIVVQGGFWRIASCWSDNNYIYFGELGGGLFIIDIKKLNILAEFGYPDCNTFACHGLGGDSKGNLFISSIKGARSIGNLFKLIRM